MCQVTLHAKLMLNFYSYYLMQLLKQFFEIHFFSDYGNSVLFLHKTWKNRKVTEEI